MTVQAATAPAGLSELHARWHAEVDAAERWRLERDREPIVSQYSGRIRDKLASGHVAHWRRAQGSKHPAGLSPRGVANQWMRGRHEALRAAHLHRAYDETLIRDYGENYATLCRRSSSLERRREFALAMGIEPPAGRHISPAGAAGRLECPRWWRRQLRKAWTRAAENGQRDLGIIRKGEAPYASDDAVLHRRAQKKRSREFLEAHDVVNVDTGEQLSLFDVQQGSVSNPALRRGEFMTRCRGFEAIAADLGHVAEFVTLTAPSAFHAQLAAGGANPSFQRKVVRDAQTWLCKVWARARAKLRRLSILFYGFRIAEPHHDATPHWHCLFFVPRVAVDLLRAVIRGVWLSEFIDEAGAKERRVTFQSVDPARGSATGYIAKYISKNIDGKGAIGNERDNDTGTLVAESVERVDAWASVHGIRQFQQIGGPPVTLWREARRIRDRVEDGDIERARERADAGDWGGFVAAVGGIHAGRRTNLRLEKVETGERDRYGDCRPARVIGLRYASALAITRPHRWRIERRKGNPASSPACREARRTGSPSPSNSSLGPVSITVRGSHSEASPVPPVEHETGPPVTA